MNWLVHVFLWGLFLDSFLGLIDKGKCTITANWNSLKHFLLLHDIWNVKTHATEGIIRAHTRWTKICLRSHHGLATGETSEDGGVLSEVSWGNLFPLQQHVCFYSMVNLTVKKL